ncbi:phytoene desaturase family protein [Halobacillus mangrovi]|uniref:4,4'-diaponeurosporene oxygenase n=1 Tax=Halobacillus mangrovi TaxID=402384 RepID=A0A1W5ZWR2_9BACI|nr:phytoene desaturase family protein [Halobacillus mangrovi]ARI77681.1 phytoene desaturase [Halobacillus mangrovi]
MKAIIIGGGLGGLSTAVTLAKHGVDVKLFEKNDHFGGKMMPVEADGYHFDFGPNTITMPEVFKEVVRTGGLDPAQELPFVKLDTHTRNQFKDGTLVDFSTGRDVMKEQLSRLDPVAYKKYDSFLLEIERLFHLSERFFLHRTFSGWKDYLSPSLARSMTQVRPLQSMDRFFKKYFSNPHILQALNRYSTYVGSSPYKTPATFAMIAHLELNDGVYYVRGGNTKIAEAFVKAAENQGAALHTNARVTRIITRGKKATGVELENGEIEEADHVIVNGDLLKAVPELLAGEPRTHLSNQKIDSFDPSISAFVIMAGLDKKLNHLHHHHVIFSKDYQKEFKELKAGLYAEEPTIYIGTSSKTDPGLSPEGDNCFILVNAPPADNQTIEAEGYKELIYNQLADAGIPLRQHLRFEYMIGPKDIENKFGAYKGSLYGPSANNRMQAFMRPFNKSQDLNGLYFCGGSTHPGGGSPMVVLSGQNVANEILGRIIHIE